jgi:hypothetical protein
VIPLPAREGTRASATEPQTNGPSFPRLATMYSKSGQDTAATQTSIARFNLYVADMINWPAPSAADPSISQGEYYKRTNPALIALMYFHACLYSDVEYTPGQFTVGDTLYYIDPRWYLTYAGSTLTGDVAAEAVRLPVQDLQPFAIGDRVLLGGGTAKPRPNCQLWSTSPPRAGRVTSWSQGACYRRAAGSQRAPTSRATTYAPWLMRLVCARRCF